MLPTSQLTANIPRTLFLLGTSGTDLQSLVLSPVQLFVIPWTGAQQAPMNMGFFRQDYGSELLFPTPEDLPDQGSNLSLLFLLKWQVDSLTLRHLGSPAGPIVIRCGHRTVFGYLSVSKGKIFQSETVNYQCLISSSFCPLRLFVEDFLL